MMKWINKKRNKKGFTLVELIVVISILGVLAAIAVPRLSGAKINAEKSAHNTNVATIESAVELALINGDVLVGIAGKDDENVGKIEDLEVLVTNGYLSNKPMVPYTIDEDNKKGNPYVVKLQNGTNTDGIITTKIITVTPGKQD